jgi:hypothetical protein
MNDISPEERLRRVGLTLPDPPPALANYELAVRTGPLLFLAATRQSGPGNTSTSAR